MIAALERGGLEEWRRLAAAVRREPRGPTARRLEDALRATRPYGSAAPSSALLVRMERVAEARRGKEARSG